MQEKQTPPPLPKQVMPYRDPQQEKSQNGNMASAVLGPNLRWKDNLYQALAILVFAIIGGIVGAIRGGEAMFAILGVIVGLVTGLFLSGFFLMIFRGIQHSRGQ